MRPSVQFSLLKKAKRFPTISLYLIQNILLGWLVEPIYWIQKTIYKRPNDMPDPIFIIGSWRSGTTYLHSEIVKATNAATIKNTFSCCPQAALIFKEFKYHRTIGEGQCFFLEFHCKVNGLDAVGVDIVTLDDSGLIKFFEVVMRPHKTVGELRKEMNVRTMQDPFFQKLAFNR